ncbi:hypothetical protein, partial [Novosphingobium sp.]|uniref:hypothetical protein n=1 Tax=Novosphingobium sp. TaxID=1874826 RepID=UPI0025F5FDE3
MRLAMPWPPDYDLFIHADRRTGSNCNNKRLWRQMDGVNRRAGIVTGQPMANENATASLDAAPYRFAPHERPL